MIGEIFEDGESGHGEDLLLAHDAHGFVAELVGVVDGGDAGACGIERAGLSGGVDRDALADARGFVDAAVEFGFGVLIGRGKFAIDDGVRAGFVDLDEVRAFFELLADHGDEFGGVVGVRGIGENVLRGIVADGVFVAAENIDGIAADAQARAGNQPVIDGVANSGVGGAGAFGAHVALGGESGHADRRARPAWPDGALRHGFFHGLQIFRAGMEEQVDVRVDQARQQSACRRGQ